MIYKQRVKSKSLTILEMLVERMQFTQTDFRKYQNQETGFEGEQNFDKIVEQLECDCLILNDLELPFNTSTFQIDSLLITAYKIYLLEVKNYQGEFYMQDQDLYQRPQYKRSNPEKYLVRKEDYLSQLLQTKGYNYPIESKVIYINDEFTLLQAPLTSTILLPTQIPAYIKSLNSISTTITNTHKKLADTLIGMHIDDNGKRNIPEYTYESLRKGLICHRCSSTAIQIQQKYCICGNCEYKVTNTEKIIQCIDEFHLLFPDRKVTTDSIYQWCAKQFSKKSIQRVLGRYYKIVGTTKGAHYS